MRTALVLAALALAPSLRAQCFVAADDGQTEAIPCPPPVPLPPLDYGLVWRATGERKYEAVSVLRRQPDGTLAREEPGANPYAVDSIEILPDGRVVKQSLDGAAQTGAQALAAARAPAPAAPEPQPAPGSAFGGFLLLFFLVAVALAAFGVGLTIGYCVGGTPWARPLGSWLKKILRFLPIGVPPTMPPPQSMPVQARTAAPITVVPTSPAAGPSGVLLRGRFEVRGKIGNGGMGVVYAGFDHALGRRVAIKQLRAELKQDPERRDAFLSEARIISHLSHPYIVGFHDVVEIGDEIYLVFDFVDGKPLSQILAERKRLPLAECQRIFGQVCEAVACAHQARVLHRDLKPANIMVDSRDYVKVMDFGIAREAQETVTRLTGVDTAGTPGYMAPEQHMGRGAKASDIYSLGVCLYEAMTGKLPFSGPDFLIQKERMKYPPPHYFAPDLPKETEQLFAAVFVADPRQRIADATRLAEALMSLKPALAS